MGIMDKADVYNGRLSRPSLERKKHFKTPSLEGKDKYMVTGRGLPSPVYIYFFPSELDAKIKKYKAKGQCIVGPINHHVSK